MPIKGPCTEGRSRLYWGGGVSVPRVVTLQREVPCAEERPSVPSEGPKEAPMLRGNTLSRKILCTFCDEKIDGAGIIEESSFSADLKHCVRVVLK